VWASERLLAGMVGPGTLLRTAPFVIAGIFSGPRVPPHPDLRLTGDPGRAVPRRRGRLARAGGGR
jgi:hypothetical protein